MPQPHFTSPFVGCEGYTVKQGERIDPAEAGQRARVEIVLVRTKPTFRCSGCGRETTEIHEMTIRCIRDLPILDADTYVWFPRYRVACAMCGPKIEALS